MKMRVYTDTSALGGCEVEQFRVPPRRLLEAFIRGDMTLVLSELTLRELEAAPEIIRTLVSGVPEAHIDTLSISPDAEELAAGYIHERAIGASMRIDALHIAMATIARVDVLVSWNFRHIVNLRRIQAYNAVNLKRGYPLLEIRTSKEVVGDE
ncbi:MAG: PIN domain protein [Candidatus Eisenbacteria bacterium]|nr:PIN domain protein [Candidatus Eisenbacteria bacterium]